ncbi:hypothetical protein, partial [Ralstonia pseudosolanacearum]|uniref:hypothetical protein n=2 Tax=Ralstonia pseudosolanacearum TaxID=1310165 RepID=UPI0026756E19
PCCATAPFTNHKPPLTLDETHRGTPPFISSIPAGIYRGLLRYDKADHWRIQLDWVPTTVPTSRSTLATCLTIRKAAFSSAWRFRMEKCAMFSIRSRPTLI